MLASVNARNYGAYARTRAAVLCFGGWGLQAMLHLWPRLRLIQEQREILGRQHELPDLDRLTAFAAILPRTSPASPPFQVLQPNPEQYLPPSYLERQLAAIASEAARGMSPDLTHAEWVGGRLLQRARDAGYLQPLPFGPLPADNDLHAWPGTRADAFRAALAAAGPIARTLLSQVVDPTRLDSMQTRDPFVQTTIYVLAALGEPRASTLVWPIVSELVETFSRRHVSRVIAFFSTASFAPDDGRTIEEASVHTALRELEALTGVAGSDELSAPLAHWLADGGGAWEERVGRRLFDAVYLVDREKSNQALAESALDLAVLVGNTIEAFLTADGWGHIEQALGPEAPTGQPAYSVVGAASDYVPLAEYVAAAIEEEEKGVIRSAVLAAGPQPAVEAADLQALGATPEAFVRCFLDGGVAALAAAPDGRSAGAWPPMVQIAEGGLLAQVEAGDLRGARDPQQWAEHLQRHAAAVAARIEEAHQAAQRAWGLAADGRPDEPRGPSAPAGDDRAAAGLIQRAADLATEQIVADMTQAPDGILRARARLASWLDAVAALLRDLQPAIAAAGQEEEAYRARLHAWQTAFARAVAQHPRMIALWSRVLIAAWLAAFGLVGAFWLQRVVDLGREGRIALAIGLAAALSGLGVAAWRATVARLRQLERQRVALAQEALARLATRLLQRGLFRAYAQLGRELAGLQAAVEEALADLTSWAHAGPAPEAESAATRAAVVSPALWADVRAHIQRESADGAQPLARFRALWRAEGDDAPPWAPEANRLARRLRAALAVRQRAPADAASLAAVFREYAARAAEDLCPTHRLLADHPDLVRDAIAQYRAEQLLASARGPDGADAAEHTSADVVERLYVRAKPAAGFEVAYLLSSDVLEVEFGVGAAATTSPLHRVFEQRGLPLLSSHDPLALTLVRTVNRLAPAELILTERCRAAFMRLPPADRLRLSLLPAADARAAEDMNQETIGVIPSSPCSLPGS